MKKSVLILGGGGFIGSHLVDKFVRQNYKVTVIDGLLKESSANINNLKPNLKKINFIKSRIEEVTNLGQIVALHDLIIDSMGWTFHLLALEDPINDLNLNARSHLYLLKALKDNPGKNVIYLGSRGQYGNPKSMVITEKTPMIPEDIQGIHKLTAELYIRLFSKLYKFNATSLRFPNTFGPKQPVIGKDIGLVGLIIRDALNSKAVEIYGSKRTRSLIYVKDLVDVIYKLSRKRLLGFNSFNLAGQNISLENLAGKIISITGSGSYNIKGLPNEIRNIDIGNTKVTQNKLERVLGRIINTELTHALKETIKYFKIALK